MKACERLDQALLATPDDVGLLIARGRADAQIGNAAEAAEFFQEGARYARVNGDRTGEAEALMLAASSLSSAGNGADARTAYHRAISCFELIRSDSNVARARLALARHELAGNALGAARQQLKRCVRPLGEAADWSELGWVHDRLSEIALGDGDVQLALTHARSSVEVAAQDNDRDLFGVRLARVGTLHKEAGNLVKSSSYLTRALPYLTGTEDALPLLDALLALAESARTRGRDADVVDHLGAAKKAADTGASPGARGRVRVQLAQALGPDDLPHACTLLEEALTLFRKAGETRDSGPAWLALAGVRLQMGDPDNARDALSRARSVFEMVGDEEQVAEVVAMERAADAGRWDPA